MPPPTTRTAAAASGAGRGEAWEADYFAAEARAARAAVPTDDAATHIAKLGLTRRQVARLLGCGIGTAQKLATPGERVGREIVERALREL